MESFSVRLSGDDLVFSAAHFITLGEGCCERMHGHDLRVCAEVAGPLGPEGYVVDFIALRRALKEILAELDHRVLLPTGNPAIRVEQEIDSVEVVTEFRKWSFPNEDCVILPLVNTTAELLAQWIGRRLVAAVADLTLDSLLGKPGAAPTRLRIELFEGPGQSAVYEVVGG